MNIFFRTDASVKIGTGHVMRCLNLAEGLKKRGINVEFICREHPGNLIKFIRQKRKFPVHSISLKHGIDQTLESQSLHASWLGATKQLDAESTLRILKEKNQSIDWLIVDHYAIDHIWETNMKGFVKNIFVIDDLADRLHDCNLLIDHGIFPNSEERYKDLVPKYCKKLLGAKYALLDPEYANFRKKTLPRKNFNNLLIFFGGSDLENLTGRSLDLITDLTYPKLNVDVVLGTNNPHKRTIKKKITHLPNVTVHEALSSLIELMLKADFSLGGGGITTYERMCLKLPSIVVAFAGNQEVVAKYLHQKHIQYKLKKDFGEKDLKRSFDEVKSIDLNLMGKIIDGQGTERVSMELLNGFGKL